MKNVLIADDDVNFLKMISKRLEKSDEKFSPVFVKDGRSLIAQLRKKNIDLVVSDLQMPKVDGYGILDHINENYPDIPVIIMTGFGRPKSKLILEEKGAAAYFEKPVNYEDLISKINYFLDKQSDGGVLKSSSLEMFTQLVEMEQKTCTIRVRRSNNQKDGVLFFRDGQIFSARIGDSKGVDVAHRIFSWQNVSLFIENECRAKIKTINSDLQAVLLEAMRLKDENGSDENSDLIEPDDKNKSAGKTTGDSLVFNRNLPDFKKMNGVNAVYEDISWNRFIKRAGEMGAFLQTGELKACYVSRTDSKKFIIVPDSDPMVLDVGANCDKEKIIKTLMD